MASSEERMKILKMIEEGKLSAEEGTKLLAALSEKRMSVPPRMPGMPGAPRWLRIRVTDVRSGRSKASAGPVAKLHLASFILRYSALNALTPSRLHLLQ